MSTKLYLALLLNTIVIGHKYLTCYQLMYFDLLGARTLVFCWFKVTILISEILIKFYTT